MAWTNDRAVVAALSRSRSADDPALADAREQLKASRAAARVDDYIRKLVAEASPLTAEQRDRLALLLRGPSESGGAAT